MNDHHPTLLQVALAVPVGNYFDYLCPKSIALPECGVQVKVPFGSRHLIGMVVGTSTTSTIAKAKLKPIIEVVNPNPILPPFWLTFAQFLSSYYHYPLGETLAVMLPTHIRQGKHQDDTVIIYRTPSDKPLTAKQQQALALIDTLTPPITATRLQSLGIATRTLNALHQKNHLSTEPQTQAQATNTLSPSPITPNTTLKSTLSPAASLLKQSPPTLNDEQKTAIASIDAVIQENRYQGFLLHGVTGSGKTEVYLQTIYTALAQDKQVLVIVPEIGLTPQTKARFYERFATNIIVLHSQMTDSERLAGFLACKNGTAQIVIATRSAIFYPFTRLGLIIIDEAHDTSYKQQDHLRYHTCDVALYLAYKLGIPAVFGSATPSLEQLHLCEIGKLTQLLLNRRINQSHLKYHIIDNRINAFITHDQTPSVINQQTVHQIRACLEQGEQVLIFLNRRGYAPIVLCHACGYQADCIRCSSHLTLHKSRFGDMLKCHHCHYSTHLPSHCPNCRSPNLITLGQGTSQIFAELHALFANPQTSKQVYPILQIDKDTTSKKNDWNTIYRTILTNEPMILVGTQMLAKGHHFPKVSLVVIVDGDTGLLSPNFRAPEHICQQIIQVAGRAGRADTTANVLIQTLKPDNPLLTSLVKNGYTHVAHTLLQERKLLGLPPITHAANIIAQSRDESLGLTVLNALQQHFIAEGIHALTPTFATIKKKNNQYYSECLLLSPHRPSLHQALRNWPALKNQYGNNKVRLSLDIDPL